MKLSFDFYENDFMVETPDGPLKIRDFYIGVRKELGISISKLERDSGLNHPMLYNIEHPNNKGYRSNAVKPMLAALETMGYNLELLG